MSEEHLISLYIDDEMDMDQKIIFVKTVHDSRPFADTALALLRQEQLLRGDLTQPAFRVDSRMIPVPPSRFTPLFPWYKLLAGAACTVVLAIGFVFIFQFQIPFVPMQQARLVQNQETDEPALPVSLEYQQRFVLYLPGSRQAHIVGTFTNWKPLAMERIGESGYWALTLPVPPGEHRYSYLIEENKRIADPTVIAREQDDFGGENSIIEVQRKV